MILFISACDDGQDEQSEADSKEEIAKTEVKSDDDLTELEKENEELRKKLAEKEKEEAEDDSAEKEPTDSENASS